jgi:Aldo/keto reductase family
MANRSSLVAQRFKRYRTLPVMPIIGARKLSQLQDNLAAFNLELSAEQLNFFDEASRVELGFPYDLYNKEMNSSVCVWRDAGSSTGLVATNVDSGKKWTFVVDEGGLSHVQKNNGPDSISAIFSSSSSRRPKIFCRMSIGHLPIVLFTEARMKIHNLLTAASPGVKSRL